MICKNSENSVYSAEQVEDSLQVNTSLDGKHLDTLNGKTTPNESLPKESKTDSLTKPQYSAISEHSLVKGTPEDIEEWLMSFPVVSHVNHSQSQENKPAKTIRETCGLPLAKLSTSSDHPESYWKMSQVLLVVDISETFLKTFPISGIMQGGKLYQQPKQVPVINGPGCGSWPTPTSMDHVKRKGMRPSRAATGRKTGYLSEMIQQWPTPTKCGNHNRKGLSKSSGDGLATAVKKFPTPQNRDFRSGQSKRVGRKGYQTDLNDFVKKYPTPNASDHRDRGGPSDKCIQRREKIGKSIELSMKFDGQLNPDWVEWLMGWPVGWSDLEPLTELIWLDPSIDPHSGIPRVTTKKENRTNRLKAIGNGQYPQTASTAWNILNGETT